MYSTCAKTLSGIYILCEFCTVKQAAGSEGHTFICSLKIYSRPKADDTNGLWVGIVVWFGMSINLCVCSKRELAVQVIIKHPVF